MKQLATTIPGVGEALDAVTLVSPQSSTFDRLLATLSLALSVVTGGTSLNYGAFAGVTRGGTEVIQRVMSRAELVATESSGLLRGGRSGTHYASDAVNSTAGRAQQRLALPHTPELRVTLEVPSGHFSPPSRVQPNFNMPGGGMERTAVGNVPARVLRVDEYRGP